MNNKVTKRGEVSDIKSRVFSFKKVVTAVYQYSLHFKYYRS